MAVGPKVSVGKALLVGFLWVTAPVLILIVVGFCGLIYLLLGTLQDIGWREAARAGAFYLCLLPACALGWLWWSISVPKWRLWALERVEDWPRLKRWAVATGLIWPDKTSWGRFFSKTEIKSAEHARREHEVEKQALTRRQLSESV
jgi:hypothetical protein